MDALKRVFANTPQLRKLHIISGSDSEDFDNLLLPKLEILQAPASTCKNLVPGRPISFLTISWRPVTRYTSLRGHDAATFCLSTQTLRHLGVPLQFYINTPFSRSFKGLRSLELSVTVDSVYYRGLTSTASRTVDEVSGHTEPIKASTEPSDS